MQEQTLMTMRGRVRAAFDFARSVEPRSLPSRRDLYADAALAVLVVFAVRLTVRGGGMPVALLVAGALLAARRRYPLAACVLLVFEVLLTRYDVKPVALGIVVFGGYSAVKYTRVRGAAIVTIRLLWVIAVAVIWGWTALVIVLSMALTFT
ncbi:MAG: hypothetical protein ACRDPA_29815, partial [Solirubrobacteraceae bacterium]